MKYKKLLCAVLTLVLLLGLCPAARGAQEPTLCLADAQVSAGDKVTLTVSIENNPGLAGTIVYLYYDTSVFTVTPAQDIAAAGTFRETGAVLGNTIALARANGRYEGEEGRDGALAFWYNAQGIDTHGDGAMLTFTLHAAATAANGEYTVALGSFPDDTVNAAGQKIALRVASATVTVTGGQQSGEGPIAFSDVRGHWAQRYIEQAASRGLIVGFAGRYRPDDTMTRAECVTILHRAAGSPVPNGAPSFTDLDPSQAWYWDAVAWAEEQQIVNGVGGGRFDPNGIVTREQLAVMLHRLAGEPTGMEALLTQVYDQTYTDSTQIGTWAKAGLYWSVYHDIFCGTDTVTPGTALSPNEAADRAQLAVMLVRFLQQ